MSVTMELNCFHHIIFYTLLYILLIQLFYLNMN